MKKIFKILLTMFGAIMLLLLGTLAVLLLASDDTRKEWLIAGVGYATDREVVIDGEFKLSLGSSVVLHATKVRVANADWGGHPVLFRTEMLDASVALWPLLRSRFEFDLSLSAPELMLETSEQGVGNWDLKEAAGQSTYLELPLTVAPREIIITDGRFFYREYGVEQQDEGEIERFYLAVLKGQQVLELVGHFNELPLSLKSDRSVGVGMEAEAATQLSMQGQIGRLSIQAAGTTKGAVEPGDPELDLAINFESPSLRIVGGQLGQMLPDLGPLKGKARLHGPMSAPVLGELEAILDSVRGKLKVSGAIGDVVNMSGFDMHVDAETRHLGELLKAFEVDSGLTLPPRMQAEARLSGDWPVLALADIKGKATDGVSDAVVSGQISDFLNLHGVDLLVKLNAPTLADLSLYQNTGLFDLQKIGPVTGSSRITAKDGVWGASEMQFNAGNENSWIRYKGEIADLAGLQGVNVELHAKLQSLEALQIDLPYATTELGPVEYHSVLKDGEGDSGDLVFRAEATIGTLKLVTTGSIGELLAEEQLAFDFELAADQLSHIGELVGQTLPGVGPVKCSGRLVKQGDTIRLEQLEAEAGNSDLAGHFSFSLADRPDPTEDVLGGHLTSNTLDLTELLPEREAVEITLLENQKMVEYTEDPAAPSAKLFSTDLLPLKQLRRFRTQIQLDANKVITSPVVLDKLQMVFSLVDDTLMLQPFSAQTGGKPVVMEMMLNASSSPATLKLELHGDDIRVVHIPSVFPGLGLEGGDVSFHADILGEGDSMAAMMASLDGSLAFAIVDSQYAEMSASATGESLLNKIAPVRKKGDRNELVCGAAYFEIKDGVATMPRGIAAQFEEITWLGRGDINLATEHIHISAKPKHRKGLGINLNQVANLVLLGGTLANPIVQIDPVGVAGTFAHYSAAVSSGGLSLLLTGLLDKSQANERVCLQIMKPESAEHATEPDTQTNSAGSELLDGD
jgi:uncharacterized protein involved in outer membrane biogenesis